MYSFMMFTISQPKFFSCFLEVVSIVVNNNVNFRCHWKLKLFIQNIKFTFEFT